ncbi:MAG: EamA family transporter [Actinobacteria bacterium]|nr:EamA family transporter [Actinomycetota bacterium]
MSREPGNKSRTVLTATTALSPAVWGTTYLVATEFLPEGRPMLAAMVRALPVGLAFVLWSRRLPSGDWWWRAGVLGVLNIGAFFALLFVAAFRLPGGVAATAGATLPLVAAGVAALLIGEAFTRRTAIAGVVGVIGVAMLVLEPGANLDAIGIVAALAGTVSMATGVVLTKRWGRPVDLITFTGWQLTAGGLVLVPVVLIAEGLPSTITSTNVAGFAWLATIGTGLAYANWFRGVQALPIAITSFLGLLSPLVATTAGWVIVGEGLAPLQLVGVGLVATAVIFPQLQTGNQRLNRDAASPCTEQPMTEGPDHHLGRWPQRSCRQQTSRPQIPIVRSTHE